MPVDFAQSVDIGDRIRELLGEYRPGQLVNELLQNADDAGAKILVIAIDKRWFGRQSIRNASLAQMQGPAVLAYNSAAFKEADFKNICRVGGATKKQDAETTGRYGLGFNTNYHITATPQLLSGTKFAVFDAGRTCPELKGGQMHDFLIEKTDVVAEELEPLTAGLASVTGEEWNGAIPPLRVSSQYSGTLFRFPLRTIPDELVSAGRLHTPNQILETIVNSVRDAKPTLFLTSVLELAVYEIDESGRATLHFRQRVDRADDAARQAQCIARMYLPVNVCGELVLHTTYTNGSNERSNWIIAATMHDPNKVDGRKLLASAAARMDVGEHAASKHLVYSTLPVPNVVNPLPFHVNAQFALSSDRRNIDRYDEWNQRVAKTALPRVALNLIKATVKTVMSTMGLTSDDPVALAADVYRLWPLISEWDVLPDFVPQLFKLAATESILWSYQTRGLVSPSKAHVLSDTCFGEARAGLMHSLAQCYRALTADDIIAVVPATIARRFNPSKTEQQKKEREFVARAIAGCYDALCARDPARADEAIEVALTHFDMLVEASADFAAKLRQVPFITCGTKGERRRPSEVLADSSPLWDALPHDSIRKPTGLFAQNTPMGRALQSTKLLAVQPTDEMLLEAAVLVQRDAAACTATSSEIQARA